MKTTTTTTPKRERKKQTNKLNKQTNNSSKILGPKNYFHIFLKHAEVIAHDKEKISSKKITCISTKTAGCIGILP